MDQNPHLAYLTELRRDISEGERRIAELRDRLKAEESRVSHMRTLEPLIADLAGVPARAVEAEETRPPIVEAPPPQLADPGSNGTQHHDEGPAKHADVAEAILREAGRPMKVTEIIDGMLSRGHALPEDSVRRFGAVHSALQRRRNTFVRVNRGVWGLTEAQPKARRGSGNSFNGMTQVEAAATVLNSLGRPATIGEILDGLESRGFQHKVDREHTYNSFYSAFARSKKIRRFGSLGEGRWGLPEMSEAGDAE